MITFSLSKTAELLGGTHLGPDALFSAVSTDSRTLAPGDLFVALQGPHFDGHDYLELVRDRGAAGALVSRVAESALPMVRVADTRLGLGELASRWRRAGAAGLVAVTGSNGKTTVKEMVAAILARLGPTLATEGNLNNDIGLPQTLLRLQEESFAVVEMGANAPGEIDYLSRIARPDVALLNNAGRAHLEGFKTAEGVARAKGEILSGLAEGGTFVFNADSPWAPLWRELAGGRTQRTFGFDPSADVNSPGEAEEAYWDEGGFLHRFPVRTPSGEVEIELPLAGRHNRKNALAALAAAEAMGAGFGEIRAGLAGLKPVRGRLQRRPGADGIRLVDDSYNANPDSVTAAVDLLATAPGRRFLLLGELAELGEASAALHRKVGEQAREAGIDELYCVGEACLAVAEGFGHGHHFPDRDALIETLQKTLKEGDCVLVKGSRSAGMEKVADALAIETGEN